MLQVKLEEPTAENSCQAKLNQGLYAIVDRPTPPCILVYKWVAVKWNFRWYAYSRTKLDGSHSNVAMHRLIANTPPGEVCHHYNKHSLDNRFGNLLNLTPRLHGQLHGIRRWGHKKKLITRK